MSIVRARAPRARCGRDQLHVPVQVAGQPGLRRLDWLRIPPCAWRCRPRHQRRAGLAQALAVKTYPAPQLPLYARRWCSAHHVVWRTRVFGYSPHDGIAWHRSCKYAGAKSRSVQRCCLSPTGCRGSRRVIALEEGSGLAPAGPLPLSTSRAPRRMHGSVNLFVVHSAVMDLG